MLGLGLDGGWDGDNLLADEVLVDVRDDTTTGNGGLDERVELLVSADGELQVAGSDTLHLQILGGISGKLENLVGEKIRQARHQLMKW